MDRTDGIWAGGTIPAWCWSFKANDGREPGAIRGKMHGEPVEPDADKGRGAGDEIIERRGV